MIATEQWGGGKMQYITFLIFSPISYYLYLPEDFPLFNI